MIEKNGEDRDSQYSYLIVNKTLRNTLFGAVATCTIISSIVIFAEIRRESHWLIIVGLGSVTGLVMLFFPSTENWVYQPWQKAPQRLERHDGK